MLLLPRSFVYKNAISYAFLLSSFKLLMKRVLLWLVICLVQFSCKKQTIFLNEGVITGVDARLCPCVVTCPWACSSLIFHFTNRGDTTRVISENPGTIQLSADVRYPVYIKLNWVNTTRCNIQAVKITDYKIR